MRCLLIHTAHAAGHVAGLGCGLGCRLLGDEGLGRQNHAVGVSGIAWATPIADWIAFVISVALIVPQLRQLKAEA